jgi:hypothetical protein
VVIFLDPVLPRDTGCGKVNFDVGSGDGDDFSLLTFHARSLVVDKLDDSVSLCNGGLAYFYFNYRAGLEQTPEKVAACLVRQLGAQVPELPEQLEQLYAKLQQKQKWPEFEALCHVLEKLVLSFPGAWIAFDALDECAEHSRQVILGLIKRLEKAGARIFATSRPHVDSIQRHFSNALRVTVTASIPDLRRLVETRLAVEGATERLPVEFKAAIVSDVSKNANGM